jgi:hypothetical protein
MKVCFKFERLKQRRFDMRKVFIMKFSMRKSYDCNVLDGSYSLLDVSHGVASFHVSCEEIALSLIRCAYIMICVNIFRLC